jgi:hypothetical protein
VVTKLGDEDRGSIPDMSREGISSLLHRVQTGPEAHPACCPVDIEVSFPVGKVATYLHLEPRLRKSGAIPPLTPTSSWRCALLKVRHMSNVAHKNRVSETGSISDIRRASDVEPNLKGPVTGLIFLAEPSA